jgi:phospho-N-acetylmuramoyl-pentapeptide-transferase
MGGTVIIFSVIFAYFISHLLTGREPTVSALLVLGLMSGLGFVGFLDDWLKVSRQRSLGLRARSKMFGQSVVAIKFSR